VETIGLASPQLAFSRDGHRLVAVDEDGVSIVDLRDRPTRRIAVARARAAVAFSDQVWVVRGGTVERFEYDGAHRDVIPFALPEMGAMVAAPVGEAAALYSATPPLALLEDAGALRTGAVPACDVAIPLTGRRWVTVTGARVTVPSGLACELEPGSRVLDGAIVFDGTAVALVVDRASGGRELVMIALSNGRPVLRRGLPLGSLRVAARRGRLGVLVNSRTIVMVDLLSGRVLGEIETPADVADFALDPNGKRAVVRDASGNIELVDIAAALAAPRTAAASTVEAVGTAPIPTVRTPLAATPDPVRVAPTIVRPLELRALAPLSTVAPRDREDALALLELELRTVGLWTLRAISESWDSRRIGYGNEGHHPYEHEVAALLGMNHGFAADHIAAAREHLADHVAKLPADLRDARSSLGALAAELGLSPLALDVLLVVAAPSLWSEAARLYGILANDPGRAVVDEALLEQILGEGVGRHALASELDPRAPLVRLGIIHVDARTRPFAGLTVHPIILSRLRRELPDLGLGLTARGSDRGLEELVIGGTVVTDALAALARSSVPARIAVRGRPGSGRRTLLSAIAAEAHRALGIVDISLLPRRDGALAGAIAASIRAAQLAGLLPCVLGLEDIAFGERDVREAVAEVLRAHPGPLAVILPTEAAAPLDAGHVAIDLPVLAEHERLAVWKRALADAGVAVSNLDALAARYRIGPGIIHRALAALDRNVLADDATPALEGYLRQLRDARLGAHARRVERLASWDRLVLPSDVTDSLRELVGRVRHRKTVFETWGMEEAMSTSRGLTALFSGPPGTGKTLVAGVIARELGLDLYQVDLSKLMSKWLGETERNLAAIFDAAEDGQVILLFDEADSLFAKRTEVKSSNDRYANLEVNYLLQRLDAFEGIAILTTNAIKSIDPAFKRRLSFRLSFPFPDEDTREQLWRAHLPPALPIEGELALDRLAHKYQLSGGYIRNACLRAAFLAAADETALTQNHLERAVTLEFAELGKLSNSGAID